jgi:biotin transporter BioY
MTTIHPKVAAGGAAGAASIIIVFVLAALGLPVPPEVASAITTLLTFEAGYLKRG